MFNIVSYIIFLTVSSYITIDVGRRCFQAGKSYLEYLLHDQEMCLTINRILLGCYYLLNLGYIAVNLAFWDRVSSMEEIIAITSVRIGYIALILCILHYMNILTLYVLRNKLTLK
ncbi:hypothetical protein [Chryseobacterium carnipullorum]|uniref:hypothetical protein n=1 Tax=Chryseobacterium carnipullorum TaxID=1124835 RepID=UPI000E86B1DE|nr:hypothetical protein [Chryseobacterium carnipullorum]HBV16694.1 hypothetical protein [Chryseobacterium carnipullorum]